MAKSKSTTAVSLIAMLARSRDEIFQQAASDGGRTLTDIELDRLDALNNTIANATPTNRRDAAVQVEVACEVIELLHEDETAPALLEVAFVALHSAKQMLRTA